MSKNHWKTLCVIVLSAFLLSACVLTITSFTAPDTAETGEVITLEIQADAVDQEDGATQYGLALQIPETWQVISAGTDVIFHNTVNENPNYAALFSAESGYKIWGGTASENGTTGRIVTATVKVLTGSFDGSIGSTRNYMVKAIAGAYRNGAWATDDPVNAFNFASITADKYTEFVAVMKAATDTTAPSPVTPAVQGTGNGTEVRVEWNDYDEDAQKDVVEYRVYKSSSPFTNVIGMTYETVNAGTSYHYISGLTGDMTYYFAVTAVDEVSNENKAVTPVSYDTPPVAIQGMVFEWQCTGFSPCQNQKVGLYDVKITAKSQVASYSLDTYSTSGGEFMFDDLPAGNYTLAFEKLGYKVKELTAEVLENETTFLPDTELQRLEYTAEEFEAERNRWDVDNNNQIGLPEAIHALQVVAGMQENN